MNAKKIVVVGAGGFAREVKWLIEEISSYSNSTQKYEFIGYVVSDANSLSETDSKNGLLGNLGWLEKNKSCFDCIAIGIGSPSARITVANQLENEFGSEYWPALIHPSVRLDEKSCRISHGVIICANCVGTVNLDIQPFALVNLSCTVGHEAVIGRGSVLNPTVNISGGVFVGEGVLIGTGAQVLQYLDIGMNSTVGAGAVVTKNVPVGTTVVGCPAKPLHR